MAEQFAVAFYPEVGQRVEIVGPFRSEERADEARTRIGAALDPDDEFGVIPHVLTLLTEAEAIQQYGPSPTDEASE